MAASKMTADKDKLRDEVLNSLQSIISSCGGECQADGLYKDYKDLLGSPVPVKQLNHANLASFLLAFPALFHCTNRGGQLFVKLKADSAGNIATFARNQKVATRRIKGRPSNKPARRPGPSSWTPCHDIRYSRGSIDQNWREPFRPLNMMGNSGPRPRNLRSGERKLYFPPARQTNRMGFHPRLQAPPRRPENLTFNKPKSPPPYPPPYISKSPPPFKSKSPPLIMNQPLIKCPPLIKSPPLMKSPPLINIKPPLLPTPNLPKVNPSALYYNDGNFTFPRAIRDNQEKQYAPYFEVPPRFKKTENKSTVKTNKQKLEEEMAKLGYKQDLVFRLIPCGKKKNRWMSTVTLPGVFDAPVSCYPEDYAVVQEAEEEAARRALEKLLSNERKTSPLPVTRNLIISINRVKKICDQQPDDVPLWLPFVQEKYKEEFKEELPDNWPVEVDEYNTRNNITHGLQVEKPVNNRWTVMVKNQEAPSIIKQQFTQPEDTVNSSVMYEKMRQHCLNNQQNEIYQEQRISEHKVSEHLFQAHEVNEHQFQVQHQDVNLNSSNMIVNKLDDIKLDGGEDDEDVQQLPSLELPIAGYWDIYVTYIEDLSSIHFRLIGDNYSSAYDDMVTEMELHYMEDKNMSPVTQPKIGSIYAASHDESWCRVKVKSISGSKATVLFLDHGDQENVSVSQLHDLHEKFFELPAQGVCCSLAGLEFGGRDQSALNLLQNLALGQTLVSQVVSRGNSISLILYNTSTDEDVNINKKVSEQMDLNFVEPTLPSVGGVAEVYLIHTTSSGDVYVQVETETYKVLQNLLELARSRTEEMLGENGMIDLTRLYLARFSEDGEWYRAVPRGNADPDGKVLMWFVDFGNSDQVPTASIRPLELNDKLTKIPHQALMCRLHNVPPSEGLQWTSRTCQRILDLIPEDSPLLLKVHASGTNGGPPQVELFKRLHPKNELVSINATLSMDESLFSSDGDTNNNSLRKEVILSPTRMRNRCGFSNSITSGSSGINSGPSSVTGQYEKSSRASSPLDISRRFKQPGSLLPMDMPAIGEFFDVYITYAASPSNFAVQPWKMTHKVSSLMEEMQTYYSNPDHLKSEKNMKVGEYFAVKHTDGYWYRAYLTMVSDIATGLFVDYGDCFVVTEDCVQPLPDVFHSLPCQAIKAKLAGVVAANMDWKPEDSYRFKELVEYRELVSIITNIEREMDTEEFVLSLRLVDTSDPKLDVYIDEILVTENRAIKLNE